MFVNYLLTKIMFFYTTNHHKDEKNEQRLVQDNHYDLRLTTNRLITNIMVFCVWEFILLVSLIDKGMNNGLGNYYHGLLDPRQPKPPSIHTLT